MRQLHRRMLLAILFLALAVPVVVATPLGLDTHVVASANAYPASNVVVDVAGTLTLINADLRAHDVVAVATGPDTNPWCGRFAAGECPLFASPLVGLGEEAVVAGTEQLTPLESYEFYCSIHSWMKGTLTAI